MAWIRARRTRQLGSEGVPDIVPARRGAQRFSPRLEALENRLQPGDTLLGVSVVAPQAFASTSWDTPLAIVGEEPGQTTPARRWSDSEGADPLAGLLGTPPSSPKEPSPGRFSDCTLQDVGTPITKPVELALLQEPVSVAAMAANLPERGDGSVSLALAAAFGPTDAGGGGERQAGGVASSVSFAGSKEVPRRAALGFAGGSALSFDTAHGVLAIRAESGPHTVREGVAADGFLEVTLDGQSHSSNPASASFDRALAGATAATLAGIRLDSSGDNTLVIGSGHLPGPFTVQASGGTVVTENVVTAGPLTIQAANITVTSALQGSRVDLAAAQWVDVHAAGRIQAAPSASGSGIAVSAETFVNSGELHADGLSGGQIVVQADKILNAGPITADATGRGGNGGQVDIAFTESYIATAAADVSVRNAAGPAGHVRIDGGSTGRLYSSGRHSATGSTGGSIALLGREVVLVGAAVDASGEAGGGTVHIGGDVQGRRTAVRHAQAVTVTAATTLRADALRRGNGGQVIAWADGDTSFAGTVSARGGPAGGAGGFIEVSGTGNLAYAGMADASAAVGRAGTLLLDPKNLVISDAPVGLFPQYDLIDPHPTIGSGFADARLLSNGNIIVGNSTDDFGGTRAGAVYLFNAHTGTLLSALVGSSPNDLVGSNGVTLLTNGNYVLLDPVWNGNRGAATWGSGTTGVSGTVSEANSLVGSSPYDYVGFGGSYALSNGNYVVSSFTWNANRGAVTWGNGSTGITGTVSEANSLIGSAPGEYIGEHLLTLLSNGNYVVPSPLWNNLRGAVTWGDGTQGVTGVISEDNSLVGASGVLALSNGNYLATGGYGGRGSVTWANGMTGIRGTVSEANSLVGSRPNDLGGFITPLPNGNYVVQIFDWNDRRGAVTWGDGTQGVTGVISEANSLVGSDPGDMVGYVLTLSNGNYVVYSPSWSGGRGAVTWGDGTQGVHGTVSDSNSLVGSSPGDQVGNTDRGVVALTNGNYVVQSPHWNGNRGAATWGSGTQGVTGPVSEANSLVGSNPGDSVGMVTPLTNGNYVVLSASWDDGRGAATWGSGTQGVTGPVSEANSLVGTSPGDGVHSGVGALTNGNYVVIHPSWNENRGAVTWASGTAPFSAVISEANSLVGSSPGDGVHSGGGGLTNGNYLVDNPSWNEGRGAVTWGSGTEGVRGVVSEDNSLVGGDPGDAIGSGLPFIGHDFVNIPGVRALSNGNYAVFSPYWNGSLGAVTWGSGTEGVRGVVSEDNSLTGSGGSGGYLFPLPNGNYVVQNVFWNDGRGAVTWVNGTTGQTRDGLGTITPQNSLLGDLPRASLEFVGENPVDHTLLAVAPFDNGSGRVVIGVPDPNQLDFDRALPQTLPITPSVLAQTLNSGTAVILQASNDLTVDSAIPVNAGGQGGALTLQAGRSIVLNASITTDNGALTLIANDQLASGVVDAQRDPGTAVIIMAAGTILDTGSAALTVELADGAGLSNPDSGAITLQTVNAGSVSVLNNGPSPGSDVILGAVTSNGPQRYASPQGTTTVTGNLTASGQPITFNDSVVLNAGLTLTARSSVVLFAGGSASPDPGVVTLAGGVVFSGATTFRVTLNGSDPGSFSQLAAHGPINLGGSTLSLLVGFEPPLGSSFEILANEGSRPISGTFNSLDEGAVFTQGGYQFQISYQGGTSGHSVVLTRLM